MLLYHPVSLTHKFCILPSCLPNNPPQPDFYFSTSNFVFIIQYAGIVYYKALGETPSRSKTEVSHKIKSNFRSFQFHSSINTHLSTHE